MSQIRTTPTGPLADYVMASQPPEHAELQRLRELTADVPRTHMQIMPEQGHFLGFLVRLTGARRVLELGTFAGYSALAMALALPSGGRLVTCDVSESLLEIGRGCWERAGVSDRIEVLIGPALDSIAALECEGARFDLVFIDADKPAYDRYYESALRLVPPGGLIVLDNTLQRGRIVDAGNDEPGVACVRSLNARIATDERVDRVMLPFADGMTLVRRRNTA